MTENGEPGRERRYKEAKRVQGGLWPQCCGETGRDAAAPGLAPSPGRAVGRWAPEARLPRGERRAEPSVPPEKTASEPGHPVLLPLRGRRPPRGSSGSCSEN